MHSRTGKLPQTSSRFLDPGFDERRLPLPIAILTSALIAFCAIELVYILKPLIEWEDLFRYVQRFSVDPYYGMTIPRSPLDYTVSEYGWQLIILSAFNQGLDFEDAFAIFSMVALGLTILAVLRETRRPIMLLLFVNPAIIDFFVSQVRSALALAIVLNFARSRPTIGLLAILAASTIHTSMMLFAIPLTLNALRRRAPDGSALAQIQSFFWPGFALMIALMLALFQTYILDLIGDRRAAYSETDISTGLLLTVAWTVVAVTAGFLTRHRGTWSGIAAAFMFGMFFFSSILGLYSHRYAPFFLPLLAMSVGGSQTPTANRLAFIGAYGVFSAVYFSYWL